MSKFMYKYVLSSCKNLTNKPFYSTFPIAISHKVPFVFQHVMSSSPCDLIYMDLWTSLVVTNIGAKYFLLIVDDLSNSMWIYFFNTKDQT